MNVYGKSFEYNNISSEEYDVMLCSFESSTGTERNTGISYDILSGDITPHRAIPNFYFRKYNEPLSFTIELCKKTCNGSDRYFSTQEQKQIVKWLTGTKDFSKLKVVDFDSSDYHNNINYYCICTSYSESVINDKIICLYFEFKCNAPYAFYEENVIPFHSTNEQPALFLVENYSDEISDDYYPILELTAQSTGEVTIVNDIYPEDKMILSLKNGQDLVIDCFEADIVDNLGLFEYNTDTNLKWIRLSPGENHITITGDVTGNIKCQYPRKVGI